MRARIRGDTTPAPLRKLKTVVVACHILGGISTMAWSSSTAVAVGQSTRTAPRLYASSSYRRTVVTERWSLREAQHTDQAGARKADSSIAEFHLSLTFDAEAWWEEWLSLAMMWTPKLRFTTKIQLSERKTDAYGESLQVLWEPTDQPNRENKERLLLAQPILHEYLSNL